MRKLEGRNAIVTGANRGIGKAIVERLACDGCNIWAVARNIDEPSFRAELETIKEKYHVNILPIHMDMSQEESIRTSFKKVYMSHIPIDILVNCAGVVNADLFQMTSMKVMREVFEVNFFGAVYLTQLVLKSMQRNRRGSIINIASISGLDAAPTNCAYGSSKAALIHFTKLLASEVGRSGIRVNAVAPGPTDTDMIKTVETAVGEPEMLARCAMARCAKPCEIADVVAFLAGDEAGFVNGQVIRVDGGSK